MPRAGLPEETKQGIREMVAQGTPQREVARAFGVNVSTISRVASDVADVAQRCKTENATAAHTALEVARSRWGAAERIELINKGFDKLNDMTDTLVFARDAKDWATATGILIDKRRLEDGESDGSAPSTLIQIQAIDYRHATAHLAPSDEGGPVGYLPAPGEGQSAGDGETLG
jgi:hypothetical protein